MNNILLIPILCFFAGIITSHIFPVSPNINNLTAFYISNISLILVLFLSRKRSNIFYVFLCAFFLILGFYRYGTDELWQKENIHEYLEDSPVEIVLYGTVSTYPEKTEGSYRSGKKFGFEAWKILKNGKEYNVKGSVLVTMLREREDVQFGDSLVLSGDLSIPYGARNPYGFDYKKFLEIKGYKTVLYSDNKDLFLDIGEASGPLIRIKRRLFGFRDKAYRVLNRELSNTTAAVTGAILLGIREGLTEQAKDLFVKTGTMHILAVSGLHVGIVAAIILGFFFLVRCPRKISFYLAIIFIFLYAVFTGSRPSSLRAAIMLSLILINKSVGRESRLLDVLVFAAFISAFLFPNQIFQTGFILSYSAVMSLLLLTPLTDEFMNVPKMKAKEGVNEFIKRMILKSLSLSLAVWIGTLPVIAAYFGIITPIVIVSNLIAIPALFVVIFLGGSLLLLSFFPALVVIKQLFSFMLERVVEGFMAIAELLSSVPFSSIKISSPGTAFVVFYYAVLVMFYIYFTRRKQSKNVIMVFLLIAFNLFVWREFSAYDPPENIRITFFDVGKADASLVETPEGITILVDAGSSGIFPGKRVDAGRYVIEPYLRGRGIRHIDYVFISHPHEDHFGGLFYLLENFSIGTVITVPERGVSEYEIEAGLYNNLTSLIEKKGCKYINVKEGDQVVNIPGIKISVFNPGLHDRVSGINDASLVFKLETNKGNSVLFTSDIGEKAMNSLLRFDAVLDSDVLKYPHHGSFPEETFILKNFIGKITPDKVVISTNSQVEKTAEFLEKEGYPDVYITSESGAVIVEEGDNGFSVKKFIAQ